MNQEFERNIDAAKGNFRALSEWQRLRNIFTASVDSGLISPLPPLEQGQASLKPQPSLQEEVEGIDLHLSKEPLDMGALAEGEKLVVRLPEAEGVGSKRFSKEAREALENKGYLIYKLPGGSIDDLKSSLGGKDMAPDHRLNIKRDLRQNHLGFMSHKSESLEVAIPTDPKKFFLLAGRTCKTVFELKKMVEGLSKELNVSGARADIGTAYQYAYLTFLHLNDQQDKGQNGSRLFGERYGFLNTVTTTIASASDLGDINSFVTVGRFGKIGLNIGDVKFNDLGEFVHVAPLILPAAENIVFKPEKIFSEEAKEALENRGYKIIDLKRGLKIFPGKNMENVSINWNRVYTSNKPDPSTRSQVAIKLDPKEFFIPRSNMKSFPQQQEMVEAFSKDLSKEIRGVKADLVTPADWVNIVSCLRKEGRDADLFRKGFTVTSESWRSTSVATVGRLGREGLTISGMTPGHGLQSVHVARVVVPV